MPGFGPLGLGVPADGYDPPPEALALVRKIDPGALDYDTDASGYYEEGDETSTRVLLALSQRVGDVQFDPLFGDRTNSLTRNRPDLQVLCERFARAALADLIADGSIELLRVEVQAADGRFGRAVTWRKTSERTERKTRF